MYKLFISIRYLRNRLTSYLCIGALSLMVAALVIVYSVMGGFHREYQTKLRGTAADITIDSQVFFGIKRPDMLEKELLTIPGVEGAAPFIENPVVVSNNFTRDYGFILGIDPVKQVQVSQLQDYLMSERETMLEIWKESIHSPGPHDGQGGSDWKNDPQIKSKILSYSPHKDIYGHFDGKPIFERFKTPENKGMPGVVVGFHLFKNFKMKFGDVIKLMTARNVEDDPNEEEFVVTGTFKTGMYEMDRRFIVCDIRASQSLIGVGKQITGINVRLTDYEKAHSLKRSLRRKIINRGIEKDKEIAGAKAKIIRDKAKEIKDLLDNNPDAPNAENLQAQLLMLEEKLFALRDQLFDDVVEREAYRVQTWEEKNINLLRAVRIERFIVTFLLAFMIFVSGWNLTSLLWAMAIEKTRDIGVIKALGGTGGGVWSIFSAQGVYIGVIGAVSGTLIGSIIVKYINDIDEKIFASIFGHRLFDPSIYYLDRIPTDYDPAALALIVTGIVVVAVGLSIIPAIKASMASPVEALRNE